MNVLEGVSGIWTPSVESADSGFTDLRAISEQALPLVEFPAESTIPASNDPTIDHVDPALAERRADVEAKHARIIEFLESGHYDAVLLGKTSSLAWISSGGELAEHLSSSTGSISVFLNAKGRAVLADNVVGPRVFEEELPGLGFQLKERPWHVPAASLIKEMCRGKRVASDLPIPGLFFEENALRLLRAPLTMTERGRYRSLGRALALAVEATARSINAGDREADVAGELAHRLIRQGIEPIELGVAADGRSARYRLPTFKAAEIARLAVISVSGRRQGLCASLSRTVSFGPVDLNFAKDHQVATMVDATCLFSSRPGQPVCEILRRARRIYEKYERPHEWSRGHQGFATGYEPVESVFSHEDTTVLSTGAAVRWRPSVSAARSEDTAVVVDGGLEVVTFPRDWPVVPVLVRELPILRPGILER